MLPSPELKNHQGNSQQALWLAILAKQICHHTTRKELKEMALNVIGSRVRGFALGFISILLVATVAQAGPVQLPPVNLGDTSFEDGIAFPGTLLEETIGYYRADSINDDNGDDLPGKNRTDIVSAATHLAYIFDYKIFGGYYGVELVLPLVDVDVKSGPVDERRASVGDLTVSPFFIQWNDRKLFGMPFFQRFVLDIILPTGSYDRDRIVNIGSNVYSINPYYAFTLMPTAKLAVSARLHYLWNSKNNDPIRAIGADDIQAGQAVHANFTASYLVSENLRIGLNGYVLQQLTDHKLNGDSLDDSRESVFAIGPGLRYTVARGTFVYLNSYFETSAENRSEGNKVVFRVSKGF